MSNLEKRLAALGLGSGAIPQINIIIFGVTPGDLDPIGYQCGDIAVHRRENESTEDLRERLRNLLEWPNPNGMYWVDGISEI